MNTAVPASNLLTCSACSVVIPNFNLYSDGVERSAWLSSGHASWQAEQRKCARHMYTVVVIIRHTTEPYISSHMITNMALAFRQSRTTAPAPSRVSPTHEVWVDAVEALQFGGHSSRVFIMPCSSAMLTTI